MIPKQELIKKLKDYFDLNIYETKAWLALIERGVASAREIAEGSGIPRSRTYDVLESLEKKGFAMSKVGKPVKFIPVKPTAVLERLKNEVIKKAEEKAGFFNKFKETKEYGELETLHKTSFNLNNVSEMSLAIKGKQNIYNHLRENVKNAKKEILMCIPASELIDKIRVFNFIFQNINKNVKFSLYLNGSDEDIEKIKKKYSLKIEKTNCKSKFAIIDRKQILFTLNDSSVSKDELAVWLNSEFFVSSIADLFSRGNPHLI